MPVDLSGGWWPCYHVRLTHGSGEGSNPYQETIPTWFQWSISALQWCWKAAKVYLELGGTIETGGKSSFGDG